MQELYDTQPPVPPSGAILVGVKLQNTMMHETEESLQELQQLAETAGIEVLCETIQPRTTPNPRYYIGEGKVEELKGVVKEVEADVIIFDDELSPAQTRNIENELDVATLDRTGLILQVFAQRALTSEARLQVSLAQLEYALPRLTRMWTHLSRMATGGGGGGAGSLRGPGETQLEMDRRWIRRQISQVKKALETVEKRRQVQRQNRSDKIKVSLVGYTNAGKSTLFNTLTGEKVLAEDKLFATLDSTTRRVSLPVGNQDILLSDTVGFIKKLPHQLVAAFKATLEEVTEADLLLHVVDVSHPKAEAQIDAVDTVLKELDASDIPMLVVLNKIDQLEKEDTLHILKSRYSDALAISAQRGDGLEELMDSLGERFASSGATLYLNIPYTEGKTLDMLYKHGTVMGTDYAEDGVHVKARLPSRYIKSVSQYSVSPDAIQGG
ncbi:GTPase HflX [Candidatus Poribacteria bacterium]|nr:MAG: GTPase HflX [Candidatus Poribacteria bacterium]